MKSVHSAQILSMPIASSAEQLKAWPFTQNAGRWDSFAACVAPMGPKSKKEISRMHWGRWMYSDLMKLFEGRGTRGPSPTG